MSAAPTLGEQRAGEAGAAAGDVLAKAGAENFPVASRLLPRALRSDLMALYGFARLVDDAGDEAPGDRRALLARLERELDAVYAQIGDANARRREEPMLDAVAAQMGADGSKERRLEEPTLDLMRRLVPTVRRHGIPREPFAHLIEANRRDQEVSRYETFDDLLDYCRLSANPVGHLVLYVFDAATAERLALADAISSGLQVVEHLQDVTEDLERGRVYLPARDMARHGCTVDDLRARPAPMRVRSLIELEAARARALLLDGLPLARMLPRRAGFAVAAFAAGGLAALDAIAAAGYDVSGGPPRSSRARRAWRLCTTIARLP